MYIVFIFQKFDLMKLTNNSKQDMVMANCYHYVEKSNKRHLTKYKKIVFHKDCIWWWTIEMDLCSLHEVPIDSWPLSHTIIKHF